MNERHINFGSNKIDAINLASNHFFHFLKISNESLRKRRSFFRFWHTDTVENRSGISVLLELVAFENIFNWFLSFTQILSHWDRINTIGFRIVCRFRIWNLYSYTSSLSQSDSFTATFLCSATRYKKGVLRHNSVLIQLINYIHLGYMPDLSSFLSYGATEQVSLLRFKTLPVTLRGLQTTCSNKNNRFKIDIRFRFRWYQ